MAGLVSLAALAASGARRASTTCMRAGRPSGKALRWTGGAARSEGAYDDYAEDTCAQRVVR